MKDLKVAIVGDDGSDGARPAGDWARGLASATGVDLAVIGVVGEDESGSAEELRADLERRVGEPTRAQGQSCTCRVLVGEPRQELRAQIDELDASMVVVGDTRHWRLGHPALASVAGHLVHHSPCPVVVVPGLARPLTGGHIVVGVDGSDGSARAAEWAAALASRSNASLTAAFVFPPLADSYPHPANVSNWHYTHEPEARAIAESVSRAGVDVDFRMIGAGRADGLLAIAKEVDASMLAVGTRGFGVFRRLLVGGTAVQLLHHSSRPVAVVPSEDDED